MYDCRVRWTKEGNASTRNWMDRPFGTEVSRWAAQTLSISFIFLVLPFRTSLTLYKRYIWCMRASRANIFFGAARATITFHTGSTRHFRFLSVAITIAPRRTSFWSPVTATIKAGGAGATDGRTCWSIFSFSARCATCCAVLVGVMIYSAVLTSSRFVMLFGVGSRISRI